MIKRGDLVRVLPAYSMETRNRSIRDEVTDLVCTVLEVRPSGDALLVRGDVRADLPDPSEEDFAVHHERCEAVREVFDAHDGCQIGTVASDGTALLRTIPIGDPIVRRSR